MTTLTKAAQEACVALTPLTLWPLHQANFAALIVLNEDDALEPDTLRALTDAMRMWRQMANDAAFALGDLVTLLEEQLAEA